MPRTRQAENKDRTKTNDREKLAKAILEILTNEATPADLKDKVEEFVCEAGNGPIAKRYALPVLEHLLTFVEWKEAHNEN